MGWRVAQEIVPHTREMPNVDVEFFSLGGLSLMEKMTGFDKVIIIDAFYGGTGHVGRVSVFPLLDMPDVSSGHTTSAHDTSLRNALRVGRGLDVALPADEDVYLVAVEAEKVYDFSNDLSARVAAAIPQAVDAVLDLLGMQTKGDE